MESTNLIRVLSATLVAGLVLPACSGAGTDETGSTDHPNVGSVIEQLRGRRGAKAKKGAHSNHGRHNGRGNPGHGNQPPPPPPPPPVTSGQACADACTYYTTAPCFGYTQDECEAGLCNSLVDGACIAEFTAFNECAAQAQIDCEASTYGYPGCDDLLGAAAECAAANQL